MRQAFEAEARTSGKSRLLLSAAVSGGKETVDSAYDVPAIAKALDFINLMTYDFHGSWESNAGHNSPLYPRGGESGWQRQLNVDWAARYWVQKGAPKDKLNIGMGLYGRSFTLASASNHQPGAPAPHPGQPGPFTGDGGVLAYYEVCDMLKAGATRVFIADQQVPYAYHGTQWVGYDDPESLRDKVRYVKQNGYGGVMVWELSMDDFTGAHCNNGHFPLMHAINSECGQSTVPVVTRAPSTTAHPVQHTTHATVVTTQKSSSSGHNTAVTCSNKADGFYTSPRSCSEYITCAAGIAYVIKCGQGLVYNANLHVCDWPANYHCTVRWAGVSAAYVLAVTLLLEEKEQKTKKGNSCTPLPVNNNLRTLSLISPIPLHPPPPISPIPLHPHRSEKETWMHKSEGECLLNLREVYSCQLRFRK
ncbi:hypothetical protein C0Q70_00141 [Pomacea canaliculata]|uniref:Uncharacterized protein n=1 Tax=Pomacea canaliculata TaxID=400727 RepID=A0A2T7PVY9_POMCA|nr:hypothetical protein C0Q70_00141 [Pomacea canaliculata]